MLKKEEEETKAVHREHLLLPLAVLNKCVLETLVMFAAHAFVLKVQFHHTRFLAERTGSQFC